MTNSSRNDPGFALFTRPEEVKRNESEVFEAKFVADVCRIFNLDRYAIRDEHRKQTGAEVLSMTALTSLYGRFPAQVAFVRTAKKFGSGIARWLQHPDKVDIVKRFFTIKDGQINRRPLFLVARYSGMKETVVLTDIPLTPFSKSLQTEIGGVTLTLSKSCDMLRFLQVHEHYRPRL